MISSYRGDGVVPWESGGPPISKLGSFGYDPCNADITIYWVNLWESLKNPQSPFLNLVFFAHVNSLNVKL